jgi:Ca2+-binding EF-hand superfamily protein
MEETRTLRRHAFIGLTGLVLASVAYAQGAAPIPRATFLTVMDGEFRKMDADKNGLVTKVEIEQFQRLQAVAESQARNRAMFAQLDRDKNGQISAAEFAAMTPPPTVNAQPLIAQYDSNHDGKVSQIEYRSIKLSRFDAIDSDKDGIVSLAEQRAAGLTK